ncbi:hypothetical protein CC2G_011651 [Coprinopsis cinerea AmutBmut pab1-1]|nr:hypothetical protein CC2G_011651 [Coprinopsis cinerea AmutBmut pab1-1]
MGTSKGGSSQKACGIHIPKKLLDPLVHGSKQACRTKTSQPSAKHNPFGITRTTNSSYAIQEAEGLNTRKEAAGLDMGGCASASDYHGVTPEGRLTLQKS